ncbi:MAG TPA: ABC transporter substrate-binding protein [Thermomicrobiales bacterium]
MSNLNDKILRGRMNRRTVLKSATGAAAGMYAFGLAGKSYQRALAQDDLRTQILKIPGAGAGSPTEQDMQKVGELCLGPTKANVKQGEFKSVKLTFMGLNNQNLHNLVFRPLLAAWGDYTGGELEWIDLAQDEIFPRIQQRLSSNNIDWDILEGGAPWEGDLLGKGLCSEMPDWVKQQIDLSDYVGYLQAPVGTWDGKTYRVSIDGDCHNYNYRSDVFADTDLAGQFKTDGGSFDFAVPTTWQQVQEVTKWMKGKKFGGQDLYGSLDVYKPWGGFGWYFFASRSTAYAKHPDDKAWLFDPETMKPRINNPAFARSAQDLIDVLPSEPPDQVNGDGNTTGFTEFLAGTGSLCHWWGDVGSNAYTSSTSVIADKVLFSILPGSPDVYNAKTGAWDKPASGPNFSPNMAYLGWGIYVMNTVDSDPVKQKMAWSVAAHLGGKDISLWLACYPSGFQPYRNSHFNVDEWAVLGYSKDVIASYLKSESDSYNHPNAAIEPRIPGIFQYYSIFETEFAKAAAGDIEVQPMLDGVAQQWEQLTDQLGRDNQVKLYQGSLGM